MPSSLNDLLRERANLAAQVAEESKSITEKNKRLSKIDAELLKLLAPLAKALAPITPQLSLDIANSFATLAMQPNDGAAQEKKKKGSYLSDPIRDVLRSAGRALTTQELYEELEKRQIKVGGQRPTANLGAHLTNVEGVVREGKGWALKSHTMQ
jgi:hypothetical protein